MKNRIYHLSTCDTCKRILNQLGDLNKFDLIDIKESNIHAEDLDWLKERTGSYEALFSKRARKYRQLGLAGKDVSEKDYRKLILQEYTFLKRPVIIYNHRAFVGNAPSVIQEAIAYVND